MQINIPLRRNIVYTNAMYLGIDIGGTKTLAASLDDYGVIQQKIKFPTNPDYPTFLTELQNAISELGEHDYRAAGVGMPASEIDRVHGIGKRYGNLPWVDVPVQADIERITQLPVALENDAKLAGLSESMLIRNHRKVLYITISTGIGTGLIVDNKIDANLADAGGANMLFHHHGSMQPWETFASGKAIVARFGKRAEDIHDAETWQIMAHDWRPGFLQLIAITDPDVIVIGGSVGVYFDRYHDILLKELKKYETPLLPIPPLLAAQRPEDAVVYGCYDYAVQCFGDPRA